MRLGNEAQHPSNHTFLTRRVFARFVSCEIMLRAGKPSVLLSTQFDILRNIGTRCHEVVTGGSGPGIIKKLCDNGTAVVSDIGAGEESDGDEYSMTISL